MRFKFLGKTFIHRKQSLATGAIIETPRDLVKAFGKDLFQLVDETTLPIAKATPIVPTPKPTPVVVKAPPPPPANTEKEEIVDVPAPVITEEPKAEEDEEINICDIESKLGKNVTHKFECATTATLCVFQSGIRYYVAKPDQPEKALNKKFLNKTSVDDFIELLDKE